MRLILGILSVLLVSTGLCACADTSLDLKEKLDVAMQGTFEAPVDADGNAEPRFQTYVLTNIVLVDSDGVETSLFTDTEPLELKIVNRSQIIYEADLHDLVNKSYASARVSFQSTVLGGGKYGDAMSVELIDPDLDIPDALTVETATNYRMNVQVQWKNTVTRDDDAGTETMTAPSFALDLGKG